MAQATVAPNGTNYRVKALIRTHEIYLDEPTDKGGGDTAPGPTEMVCAALAACTTITLQMYIQRKGWAVEVKSVKVVYETVEGTPTFHRQMLFHGANNEQLPRLTAVANACPVHKMLSTANVIDTEIIN